MGRNETVSGQNEGLDRSGKAGQVSWNWYRSRGSGGQWGYGVVGSSGGTIKCALSSQADVPKIPRISVSPVTPSFPAFHSYPERGVPTNTSSPSSRKSHPPPTVINLNSMSQDLLSGSLGADKLTARFQDTLSPKALIDLRTQKPLQPASSLNPDLIASIEHELREAVVIFEKEKQRLTGEIQRLNGVVKTQEGQLAEMMTRCTNEKRLSDRKIEDLLSRIRDLESEKSQPKSISPRPPDEPQSDDLKSSFSKQFTQAQCRLKLLESSNSELTAANTTLLEQNRALTAQLARLQSQMAIASEEQFLLLSNYRKVQQNLHEKVAAEADLKLQLAGLNSENEKIARMLNNEREKLTLRISQLEGEVRTGKESKAEQSFASTGGPAQTMDLSGAFNLSNFEVQMKDNSRRIQKLEQQLHETSHQYQAMKHSFQADEKPAARLKSSTSSRSLTPIRNHSRSQDQRSTPKPKPISPKPVKTARISRHSQKLSWKQPH